MANNPVRVFIGSSSNGEDAKIEMAYEHSIRKNCSRPVDITFMRQTNDKESFWHGWADKNWSTPFSGFRWGIPEACNFKGKAIYTDVDMINMRDMAELIDLEVPAGKLCLARDGRRFGGKEFCVIVFDCAKWEKVVPKVETWKEDVTAHHQFISMFITNNLVGKLDARWNSHDGDTDEIWQLHYTHMATQPWRPAWFTGEVQEHPRKDLVEIYEKAYDEAVLEGYKLEDYEIDRGVKYGIIGK